MIDTHLCHHVNGGLTSPSDIMIFAFVRLWKTYCQMWYIHFDWKLVGVSNSAVESPDELERPEKRHGLEPHTIRNCARAISEITREQCIEHWRHINCVINRVILHNIKTVFYWSLVKAIHRFPLVFPHKGPVMRKANPCHGSIMFSHWDQTVTRDKHVFYPPWGSRPTYKR